MTSTSTPSCDRAESSASARYAPWLKVAVMTETRAMSAASVEPRVDDVDDLARLLRPVHGPGLGHAAASKVFVVGRQRFLDGRHPRGVVFHHANQRHEPLDGRQV